MPEDTSRTPAPAGTHGHGHAHGHHHGHHHGLTPGTRAFALATLVNLAYTALEAGYGFWTGSLALLSDALHNFGDVLGLALAWGAAVLAQRPPTGRHTYGWRRATLLSPLGNALLLVGFSGALAWEALRRFSAPPEIPALPVVVIAGIGIAVNLGAAWLLRDRDGHSHAHDLNRRGAFLHLIADAAVSLAAVLAGLGMLWLDWRWLDPAIALLVAVVVAVGAFGLLRDALAAAMDAVPRAIDPDAVRAFLGGLPGVTAVHHLHIWQLGTDEIAMTAHLVRPPSPTQAGAAGEAERLEHDAFLDEACRALDRRFGINHPTLQIEHGDRCAHDREHRAHHGAHAQERAQADAHGHADAHAHGHAQGHAHGHPHAGAEAQAHPQAHPRGRANDGHDCGAA